MTTRPELPAWILSALGVISITVLAAMNKTIPTVLDYVSVGALTGASGITLGSTGTKTPPPVA